MDQTIREITPDDAVWIAGQVSLAGRIAEHYQERGNLDPIALDRVFNAWKDDQTTDKPPDQEIAQGLGCAFGDFLVRNHGVRWVVVTDSFGTELTVLSKTGWQTYPINSVWKRIDPANLDLAIFEPIYQVFLKRKV
jgi:hypothetical protein